jgi:hypothetical protein
MHLLQIPPSPCCLRTHHRGQPRLEELTTRQIKATSRSVSSDGGRGQCTQGDIACMWHIKGSKLDAGTSAPGLRGRSSTVASQGLGGRSHRCEGPGAPVPFASSRLKFACLKSALPILRRLAFCSPLNVYTPAITVKGFVKAMDRAERSIHAGCYDESHPPHHTNDSNAQA